MNIGRSIKKSIQPSHTVEILLAELGEACEAIQKLLHQLKVPGLTMDQREEILGELSAEITHLHEHTRGMDEKIIEDRSSHH